MMCSRRIDTRRDGRPVVPIILLNFFQAQLVKEILALIFEIPAILLLFLKTKAHSEMLYLLPTDRWIRRSMDL